MALKDDAWRLDPTAYAVRQCLQTRYGDMDANRHLNNVAIARLLEEARVRFHGALFGAVEAGPALGERAIMIAHLSIDYLAEGRYGADVETGVAVVAVGRTSYRLGIGLFQDGRAMALADSVMVVRGGGDDATSATLAPMSGDLRVRLDALGPQHG